MTIHDELFQRARSVMPGGVASPVRAFRAVGGTPRYVARGAGSKMYGEGGEEWVDFCLAWGPLILGHAHPEVVEAVVRAARDGTAFGTVTRAEVELAERVATAFGGRVRLVTSGTEAVMTALRLARAVTGRSLVLKFSGCYHGHSDGMLVRGGSGLVSLGIGDSAGVSAATAAETVVVALDDEAAVDEAFARHGDSLAAAIVEAVPANNGLLVQRPEWLRHLRAACTRHGTLLVLDEVITGFRFHFGGHAALVGIEPDLTTLGKIVGGGMPLAAVVGRPEILDRLAPAGDVYQAGTMAGNLVAVAAGRATLDVLARGEAYAKLEELGRHLDSLGPPFVRCGPIFWTHLGAGPPPRRDSELDPSVRPRYAEMHRRWLDAGVYLPPSAFEVAFLCTAHTPAELDRLAA